MNRQEMLFEQAAEECAEIIQRITKINRFGLHEVQPKQTRTNQQRVIDEIIDLIAVLEMLRDEGHLPAPKYAMVEELIALKKMKVEKYLEYSKQCGTLTP